MATKRVILHGKLSELIPDGVFEGYWETPYQAARAIEILYPGFRAAIQDKELLLWSGDQLYLGEEQIHWTIPGDLHIAPPIQGERNALKIILGVALFAVGIGAALMGGGGLVAGLAAPIFGNTLGITAGAVALAGAAMVFMGLSIPPVPKNGDFGDNENGKLNSVIYRGPANNQEPGAAYPLVFGYGVIAGGVAINTDIDIVQKVL